MKYSWFVLATAMLATLPATASEKKNTTQTTSSVSSSKVQVQVLRLDINQATAEQLATVKGLGQKKASAIVKYRETNGRFKSLDELVKVKGIGQKALVQLKPQLKV